MDEIIPSVSLDSTSRKYYIISSLLKDDKELRHKLRLNFVLKLQEFERIDNKYLKSCFYCKLEFEGQLSYSHLTFNRKMNDLFYIYRKTARFSQTFIDRS